MTQIYLISFLFFLIYKHKRKYWICENFWQLISMVLQVLRCPEHDLAVFRKCPSAYLSVCLQNFMDTVPQELMHRNWWTWYSVTSWYNLVLIKFWCILFKKFWCCSKFMISLTQWYMTKMRAVVPNTNNFQPIILKYKTFISNKNSKIIQHFCM